MPLEFHSLNHGRIAFGFFNIETDLLLLEKYFFFAHFFCNIVKKIASWQGHEMDEIALPGYVIERSGDVGNLMGAIQCIDLRGFIGGVYQLFPFPQSPEQFKQKPDGEANRAMLEKLINKWGQPAKIPVKLEAGSQKVRIAELLFGKAVFQELVAYVWQGGMPGWEDNLRPAYVLAMKEAISSSTSPIFKDFKL